MLIIANLQWQNGRARNKKTIFQEMLAAKVGDNESTSSTSPAKLVAQKQEGEEVREQAAKELRRRPAEVGIEVSNLKC